jgi:folylpolyglutamate synthase
MTPLVSHESHRSTAHFFERMDGFEDHDDASYEAAVQALLQVHQSQTPEAIQQAAARRTYTIADMRHYMTACTQVWTGSQEPAWLQVQQQWKPAGTAVVHITGTKGKGSTACMVERMLRDQNKRTGLFTSPHLVDIRERIRINGLPVAKKEFARAYWTIRQALEKTDCSLPGYFRMLTLMAFFLLRDCDVWILEVGMGGRYDATNCLDLTSDSPTVCAVMQLDYDHVRVLGSTLPQIAWEKGGIFAVQKDVLIPGHDHENPTTPRPSTSIQSASTSSPLLSPPSEVAPQCFALATNPPDCLDVLQKCAANEGQGRGLQLVHANLLPLDVQVGLPGPHQRHNAAMAVALVQELLQQPLDEAVLHESLARVSWPGRGQIVPMAVEGTSAVITFYLDGAHTPLSIQAARDWFMEQAFDKRRQVLIFNCSHEKNPVELLNLLGPMPASAAAPVSSSVEHAVARKRCIFDQVYFCKADSARPSAIQLPTPRECLAEAGHVVNDKLLAESQSTLERNAFNSSTGESSWQSTLQTIWYYLSLSGQSTIPAQAHCETLANVIEKLSYRAAKDSESTHVLVTGSLYIVGSVLSILESKVPGP